jgi:hypothetical protein
MGKTSAPADGDAGFERDVVRSKFLGHYAAPWDQPVERKIFSCANGQWMEVYRFGREGFDRLARVATIGAGSLLTAAKKPKAELMMALPLDLGGATFDAVAGFMMDFALFATDPHIHLRDGQTTPDSPLIPKPWEQQAVLVSSPLGEPEAFECVTLGGETSQIWWIIPIYSAERDLIRNRGIEAFDRLSQRGDLSLADVRRRPFV